MPKEKVVDVVATLSRLLEEALAGPSDSAKKNELKIRIYQNNICLDERLLSMMIPGNFS